MAAFSVIDYRLATPDDADAIADLHAASWRRHYRGVYPDDYLDGDLVGERRGVWRERFAAPNPNQIVYVAMSGELVGFVCSYLDDDPKWGALIDNLHVTHTLQRTGVGRALVARAVTDFPGPFYLWVLEANENAQRFYERLGGARADAKPASQNPDARALRYVWPSSTSLRAPELPSQRG